MRPAAPPKTAPVPFDVRVSIPRRKMPRMGPPRKLLIRLKALATGPSRLTNSAPNVAAAPQPIVPSRPTRTMWESLAWGRNSRW